MDNNLKSEIDNIILQYLRGMRSYNSMVVAINQVLAEYNPTPKEVM